LAFERIQVDRSRLVSDRDKWIFARKSMRLTVLGSGSTGNAVLITAGDTRVLVDAGMSARETVRRLALVGQVFHNSMEW